VLLLDEVHEALDQEFRHVLEEFAAELVAQGGIVVAAGHDLELLSRLCGRMVMFEGGRVRESSSFDLASAAHD
jgi:ABC-type polysaccharide/polyol phosphate transport system ATPase subunit